MTSPSEPSTEREWFQLRIIDASADEGVDSRTLAQLLNNLTDVMYTAARVRLGERGPRRGRPNALERSLAAIRIQSIRPGSLLLDVAPPPQLASLQASFFPDQLDLSADLVLADILEEVDAIAEGNPVRPQTEPTQRAIRRLLDQASSLGSVAEFRHRSISHRQTLRRVVVPLHDLPEPAQPSRRTRQASLFGHTYMVDIEPGRERLRVKLPSGSDITMDVSEDVAVDSRNLLDQVVQVDVEEEFEADQLVGRTAIRIRALENRELGVDAPPKSTAELEREQGILLRGRQAFLALTDDVWPTERDAEEFVQAVAARRSEDADRA